MVTQPSACFGTVRPVGSIAAVLATSVLLTSLTALWAGPRLLFDSRVDSSDHRVVPQLNSYPKAVHSGSSPRSSLANVSSAGLWDTLRRGVATAATAVASHGTNRPSRMSSLSDKQHQHERTPVSTLSHTSGGGHGAPRTARSTEATKGSLTKECVDAAKAHEQRVRAAAAQTRRASDSPSLVSSDTSGQPSFASRPSAASGSTSAAASLLTRVTPPPPPSPSSYDFTHVVNPFPSNDIQYQFTWRAILEAVRFARRFNISVQVSTVSRQERVLVLRLASLSTQRGFNRCHTLALPCDRRPACPIHVGVTSLTNILDQCTRASSSAPSYDPYSQEFE